MMLRANVIGNVWSSRRVDGLPNGAFLEVQIVGTRTHLIAFDTLGSGLGEQVLIAQGSAAAQWFGDEHPPIDALVIGSIDERHDPV
jgi:ethanolamine utilization protein EutN